MDCINCNANIPPQYVNALSSNICPGCGGQIMSVADRDLLKELLDGHGHPTTFQKGSPIEIILEKLVIL